MKDLNEKLTQIQNELKVKKSRYNSFGKYNFRSAEDILEAIKPLALKYNVTVYTTEKYLGDGIIQSTAIIKDKLNQIPADAIVAVDENQKGMQVPQKFGTASSYGKKYALGNLFLIDDTQDSDAINKGVTEKKNIIKTKTVLPELELDSAPYKKAIHYLEKGKYTVEQIEKKYKLSDTVKQNLININK